MLSRSLLFPRSTDGGSFYVYLLQATVKSVVVVTSSSLLQIANNMRYEIMAKVTRRITL